MIVTAVSRMQVLDAIQEECDAQAVADTYGISVEDVREICGHFGHLWETFDGVDECYFCGRELPT